MTESSDGETVIMKIFGQILILVVLTVVNAFFAGAEMAVVSVNKNKIKRLAEDGNKKATLIELLGYTPHEEQLPLQVKSNNVQITIISMHERTIDWVQVDGLQFS